jgi:hypothetical protein
LCTLVCTSTQRVAWVHGHQRTLFSAFETALQEKVKKRTQNFSESSEWKRPFGTPRWENNIIMELKETRHVDFHRTDLSHCKADLTKVMESRIT